MGKIVSGITDAVGLTDVSGAEKQQAQSMQMQKEVLSRLEKIGIPSVEAQRLILEEPELVGELIPELEGYTEELGPSTFEDVEAPEELKAAQIQALNTLQQRVEEGGLTAADEAELNEISRGLAGQQKAADAAVLQNMAERGMLGSGQELMMRRASGQDARMAAAREAEQRAALAQQNKINAAQMLGQMASQQRGQDVTEQSQKAQAADVIAQFNLQNRAAAKQRDIDRINQAQQYNLGQKQRISEAGTSTRNQQEMANKALIQQEYQNQLQKAGAAGGAQQNIASSLAQSAANKQQAFSNLIGAGAGIGAAAISDKNLKINVEKGDSEVEEMLDNIEAYDYDYVPELGEEGRHTSVMAQDLEKSELGDRFVEDTEIGKIVDYKKALPTMLASQGNLNKRLRKIEKVLQLIDEDEELV